MRVAESSTVTQPHLNLQPVYRLPGLGCSDQISPTHVDGRSTDGRSTQRSLQHPQLAGRAGGRIRESGNSSDRH